MFQTRPPPPPPVASGQSKHRFSAHDINHETVDSLVAHIAALIAPKPTKLAAVAAVPGAVGRRWHGAQPVFNFMCMNMNMSLFFFFFFSPLLWHICGSGLPGGAQGFSNAGWSGGPQNTICPSWHGSSGTPVAPNVALGGGGGGVGDRHLCNLNKGKLV